MTRLQGRRHKADKTLLAGIKVCERCIVLLCIVDPGLLLADDAPAWCWWVSSIHTRAAAYTHKTSTCRLQHIRKGSHLQLVLVKREAGVGERQ
jgi:hypothetical protein